MNEKDLLLQFFKENWKKVTGSEEGYNEKITEELMSSHPAMDNLNLFANLAIREHKRQLKELWNSIWILSTQTTDKEGFLKQLLELEKVSEKQDVTQSKKDGDGE